MNRLLPLLCVGILATHMRAADTPDGAADAKDASTAAAVGTSSEDLQRLRDQIAQEAEQIKKLQQAVESQQKLIEQTLRNSTAASAGSVHPIVGSEPVKLVPVVSATHPRTRDQSQHETTNVSPLSIHIGDTAFTPLGFVDATFFGRSTNVGSGIGTNFGSIPYNTSASGHLSEMNFSTQNSRIGFRVDSNVLEAKVLGYFEADFLGNQPGNVFVSSNSDTFRMRNVFVDVQKGGFEVLGGQDWSMATPGRKGISPLPGEIFYTQDMDTNYQAGLVWARQTQFRFVVHPNENIAFGVSLENPQQYIGGSSGGSSIVLPAAFTSLAGTQFDNGSSNYGAPNLHPDIIFKGALDGHAGDKLFHVEAAGIVRTFKAAYGLGTPATYHTSSATAASGEVNANFEVAKGVRLVANTFFGSGNGRYVFGQAPDVIVRADGSISPVHTYSTVDGFEANATKNTLLYGYYGGIYVKRDVVVDANGKLVGYGFTGSSNSQNRAIQEATFGVVQTLWKNQNYGALSLITQYSYLTRNPWYVATGTAKDSRTNMYWVDLRYTLP